MWKIAAHFGNVIIRMIAGIVASSMCLYGAYAMYDSYYTNKQAFSSWDLEQYKPTQTVEEGNDFEDILAINDNVVGWITFPDTHIDYPVAHGSNDIEYAAKDIYGEPSITGAIYLAAQNNGDFSDHYNIIYGHHMDNGAMFGDLDKFEDASYFAAHPSAYLMTPDRNYTLMIFACMQTDAYDNHVYSILRNNRLSIDELCEEIKENSAQYREVKTPVKIIAFSTCSDAVSNGRVVVFASAIETDEILEKEVPLSVGVRKAIGHGQSPAWALVNLLCVLVVCFAWLPVTHLRKKYGRKKAVKKWIAKIEDANSENKDDEHLKSLEKDLRKFIKSFNIGCILEPILLVVSIIIFILTENIFTPMILIDKYTPLMLALVAVSIATDIICFTYRGDQPEETETVSTTKGD